MTIIKKLVKFLQLEVERGYDNRAVFGGLESMLEPWEVEAKEADIPPKIIEIVISRLRDYPNLTVHSRKETLHGLLNRLSGEFPSLDDTPKVPTPHPKTSTIDEFGPPDKSIAKPKKDPQNALSEQKSPGPR